MHPQQYYTYVYLSVGQFEVSDEAAGKQSAFSCGFQKLGHVWWPSRVLTRWKYWLCFQQDSKERCQRGLEVIACPLAHLLTPCLHEHMSVWGMPFQVRPGCSQPFGGARRTTEPDTAKHQVGLGSRRRVDGPWRIPTRASSPSLCCAALTPAPSANSGATAVLGLRRLSWTTNQKQSMVLRLPVSEAGDRRTSGLSSKEPIAKLLHASAI